MNRFVGWTEMAGEVIRLGLRSGPGWGPREFGEV